MADEQKHAEARRKALALRMQGKKRLLIPVDLRTHAHLKMVAMVQSKTLEEIVIDAIADYLKKHHGPAYAQLLDLHAESLDAGDRRRAVRLWKY